MAIPKRKHTKKIPNKRSLISGSSIELEFRQEYYDNDKRLIYMQTSLDSSEIIPDAVVLKSVYTNCQKVFWIDNILTANLNPLIQIGNYTNHDMKVNLQIQFQQ